MKALPRGKAPSVRTKTPQQAEKILDAAARLFGTHRFHEVRMEDIAAEAGAGKGTLYRYFADKEELYLALLARSSDQFIQEMEAVATGPGTARQRLERMVASSMAHFDRHPHLFDLIQRAEVRSEEGRAFPWQNARERLPQLYTAVCEEARLNGEFELVDLELSLLMLMGGLRSVYRFGEKPRPPDLACRIVRGFLAGAAVPAARPAATSNGVRREAP